MSTLKKIARNTIFPAFVDMRLGKVIRSIFQPTNKLILVYHGVVESPKATI